MYAPPPWRKGLDRVGDPCILDRDNQVVCIFPLAYHVPSAYARGAIEAKLLALPAMEAALHVAQSALRNPQDMALRKAALFDVAHALDKAR